MRTQQWFRVVLGTTMILSPLQAGANDCIPSAAMRHIEPVVLETV